MDAYRRCRERFEFPAAGMLDIEAFLEGMRLRKLSLVLLHQFGRFQGGYRIPSNHEMRQSLVGLSSELGLHPQANLETAGIEALYRRYSTSPPAGTLAHAVREHGLGYDRLELHLRAFKREQVLEVYGRVQGGTGSFVQLASYRITASTFDYPLQGHAPMAGPKSRQGDGKVPEGFYTLTWQNEWSDYYGGISSRIQARPI